MYALSASDTGRRALFFFKGIQPHGRRHSLSKSLFHTLIFVLLSALLLGHSEWLRCILSGLYLGVMSHLILDLFSDGIPLFAPISMKRQCPAITFKTGSFLEAAFDLAFILISIYMFYLISLRFLTTGSIS